MFKLRWMYWFHSFRPWLYQKIMIFVLGRKLSCIVSLYQSFHQIISSKTEWYSSQDGSHYVVSYMVLKIFHQILISKSHQKRMIFKLGRMSRAISRWHFLRCWRALWYDAKLYTCCNVDCPHMGQFLQGGRNGRLMSFFFLKVEPPCDQTWWDSLVFSILSCFSYVLDAKNTLVGPVGPF